MLPARHGPGIRHFDAACAPLKDGNSMADVITISGLVATPPRHLMTSDALPITSFRLVSTQRRFDRATSKWIDGESNWFTVTAFRQLALNANSSVKKGDRVVVTGRLRIREWETGERVGTTVEIEAEAMGHDLLFGTSAFARSPQRAAAEATSGEAPAADSFAPEAPTPGGSVPDTAAERLVMVDASGVVPTTADALAVPF